MYAIRSYYAYSLTEQGIELLPLLAHASSWGLKYRPVSKELGARARVLADGGPSLWQDVITSYSIHYTKLYETARTPDMMVRKTLT